MYLSWPGRIPAGKVYDTPVSTLDFVPTALAAAGVPVEGDAKLDGVDLVPHLAGQATGRPHEALFWRFGEQHAARRRRLEAGRAALGEELLFDLASDLGEKSDLAAKEPKRLEELRAAYAAWDRTLVAPRWRRG
jgi:arylsulfatase A-like enzyme